jgi:hypothetical protein
MRAALIAGLVLVFGFAAGAFAWRDHMRTARMHDIVAARRELAATQLAPAGTAPRAGISARGPIDVAPFPDDLARRLRHDPDFHRLTHRCGVCHSTPDPRLHTAADWERVIDRMAGTIRDAGLLPLADADRAAVMRALTTRRYDDGRAP